MTTSRLSDVERPVKQETETVRKTGLHGFNTQNSCKRRALQKKWGGGRRYATHAYKFKRKSDWKMDDMKVNGTVTMWMFHYNVSEYYSGSTQFEPW